LSCRHRQIAGSGISGYRSLFDLIALLNMYATVLQPKAIVVKSGALEQFALQRRAWRSPEISTD
jgi:hypothetical protein